MPLEIQIAKKLPDFTLDVSFTADNAPLSILGPSGAGKSMLLRCVAGLENPDQGRITLNGRVLFDGHSKIAIPARERRVGMLFQHYALFPHRTVAENIAFGLDGISSDEKNRRSAALMDRVHISDLGQPISPRTFRRRAATRCDRARAGNRAGSAFAGRTALGLGYAFAKPDGRATSGNICRNSNGRFCSLHTTSKRPTGWGTGCWCFRGAASRHTATKSRYFAIRRLSKSRVLPVARISRAQKRYRPGR